MSTFSEHYLVFAIFKFLTTPMLSLWETDHEIQNHELVSDIDVQKTVFFFQKACE